MLRHAMSLGGFHQVIFICHAPQIWELADRILRVQGGQVLAESGGAEQDLAPQLYPPAQPSLASGV